MSEAQKEHGGAWMGERLLRTLVDLLAEQEGVNITYEIEAKEVAA